MIWLLIKLSFRKLWNGSFEKSFPSVCSIDHWKILVSVNYTALWKHDNALAFMCVCGGGGGGLVNYTAREAK